MSTFIKSVSLIENWARSKSVYCPYRFVVSGCSDVIAGGVVHMERRERHVSISCSGHRL